MRERTGGAIPQFYPRDDSTWENCEANRREGEDYLRVVLEESGDTRVVGEDLGTVPDYVRPSLRSLGVAGFKIPQWENYARTAAPSRAANTSACPSPPTRRTITNRSARMWEEALGRNEPRRSDQARAGPG